MDLKVITTEEEYQAALKEIERHIELENPLADCTQIDNLVDLVEADEDKNYAIPEPDSVSRMLHILENRGLIRR